MILHRDCYQNFKQLILTLPYGHPKMMILPIQTLYRDINNNYYLSKGEINQEPRIFPNSASIHFHKAEKWEKLQSRINLDWQQFPLLCIYELKDINEDEFAHWTNTDFKTERKNREYNNFQLIKKGEIASSQFEKHGSDFMTSVLPYPLSTQQLIKKTKNQELSLPAKANKSQDFEVIKTKFLTKILPYIEIKSVRHYLGRHNVNIWVLREIEVNPSTEYNLDELFKLRCIFFHIPKTAGLSVCDALFGNRGAGHINVSNARYIFGERNFRSFFKFCFVRNPWDRLVSSYHYLRKGGVRKSISPWIREKILAYDNFSEFVKVGLISTDVLNEQHFRPQYKFVCDKHDVLKVDFIGRFETLEPDFYKIIQELGIKSHLPHHNPSSREDFRQYYDDEMIEIVAKLYERDIQLFNYRFDS
ncbi:hypothetical protein CFPU101_40850 [Chroococcus sp. FPU101]|nr:hypothetical protein CFPU101_40850 [Chroococcus sp. FPU101]